MIRLDQALVERGICDTRERAKRAVMAGRVLVNRHPAQKPGESVRDEDRLELTEAERYVSRGGYKLEHALARFPVHVAGTTAVDLGASTGGFTDCLLQHGASRVYAVDVGQGQLAWSLRNDPRVVVMERANARHLTVRSFPDDFQLADLVVIDCSFISLTRLLTPAAGLLKTGGRIIALVKPQFEAGKREADKGRGVILDPVIHERVLQELQAFCAGTGGLRWLDCTESPLVGPAGNKEYLALIEHVL